jgi:hypothetical protein
MDVSLIVFRQSPGWTFAWHGTFQEVDGRLVERNGMLPRLFDGVHSPLSHETNEVCPLQENG